MRTYIPAGAISLSVSLLACGYTGKTHHAPHGFDAGSANPDAGGPLGVSVAEYAFDPRFLYAFAGDTISVILRNEGVFQHSLVFEAQGLQGIPNGVLIDPGGAYRFSVKVPVAPGAYVFFCPVEDHRALGEQGTLIVANPRDAGMGGSSLDAGTSDAASPDGAAADASASDAGPTDAAR
jgi:plastocyanin